MLSINWPTVVTSVTTTVIVTLGSWIVVRFTSWGQSFWTDLGQVCGLRTVAVVAAAALLIALGLLTTLITSSGEFPLQDVKFDVVPGDRVDAHQSPDPDPSWRVSGSCPDGSKLVGFYCGADEGVKNLGVGFLEMAGVRDSKFHCVWNGISGNFRAWGQPSCARVSMMRDALGQSPQKR